MIMVLSLTVLCLARYTIFMARIIISMVSSLTPFFQILQMTKKGSKLSNEIVQTKLVRSGKNTLFIIPLFLSYHSCISINKKNYIKDIKN